MHNKYDYSPIIHFDQNDITKIGIIPRPRPIDRQQKRHRNDSDAFFHFLNKAALQPYDGVHKRGAKMNTTEQCDYRQRTIPFPNGLTKRPRVENFRMSRWDCSEIERGKERERERNK